MSEASHRRHHLSELEGLKDQLLSGEVSYARYIKKAAPLAKQLKEEMVA